MYIISYLWLLVYQSDVRKVIRRKLTCWPPVQRRKRIWDPPPSYFQQCLSQCSYPPLRCSAGVSIPAFIICIQWETPLVLFETLTRGCSSLQSLLSVGDVTLILLTSSGEGKTGELENGVVTGERGSKDTVESVRLCPREHWTHTYSYIQ